MMQWKFWVRKLFGEAKVGLEEEQDEGQSSSDEELRTRGWSIGRWESLGSYE